MSNVCFSAKPGTGALVWKPGIFEEIARPNRWTVQEALSRVRFFPKGSYKYTPSDAYLKAYAKFRLKTHPAKPIETIVNEY